MLWWLPAVVGASPSVAFYYADSPPTDILAQYDWVVLESDHVTPPQQKALRRFGTELFAYVSLGEAERFRDSHQQLDRKMFSGENRGWNSDIVDVTHPDWQKYLLEQRIPMLWEQGYRGFFLDTLDSYQVSHDEKDWPAQQAALIGIIEKIKQKYPQAKLILNRGFEFVDKVADKVDALAVESLYAGWDQKNKKYREVSEKDRQWLRPQLARVRQLGLEVIVIDYLPPEEKQKARKIARQVLEQGFIPWVSTPQLDYIGSGSITPIPRRVLMLYDSKLEPQGQYHFSNLHFYAELPLEYLGYVPVMHDIQEGLPQSQLADRYAGVVTWFAGKTKVKGYGKWLQRLIHAGGKIVMFGNSGLQNEDMLLQLFGLERAAVPRSPLSIGGDKAMMGFEIRPRIPRHGLEYFRLVKNSKSLVHMYVQDSDDHQYPVVVSGDWGGMALRPWDVEISFDETARWVINPFLFLQQALQLADIPMPDMTTENGSRLWLNHIDGDGFLNRAEMPGNPYAAEVIYEKILKKYRYPHTVSIVEGEIGPAGLYPEASPELEAIARKIFSLPNVELASHSYSHPFVWMLLKEGASSKQGYTLPIQDYRFDLRREIQGSIDYINTRLAPANKKAGVFLWTGDAFPGEKALQLVEENGLVAMNGGETQINDLKPFLSFVSPSTRTVGTWLQIYAPVMNENIYTNNWQGPYYGFRRVIETFRLTDKPRRLKPIGIYYHFYSGSKPAALKALEQIYQWAEKQETFPLYVSDYISRVMAWRQMGVARLPDNGLLYQGGEQLRTLRWKTGHASPDFSRSSGVAGVRRLHDGDYIHLNGDNKVRLYFQKTAARAPYLLRANGRIIHWQSEGGNIDFRMHAEVPLQVVFYSGYTNCQLSSSRKIVRKYKKGNEWHYWFSSGDSGNVRFSCS